MKIVEALTAVMADVQAVKKGDWNTQQGYNFRGVDAVVNAVGPALRKHGVVVVPTATAWAAENYTTAKGTQMRSVTLTVSFRFFGPEGDYIDAQACGESSDSGDKAVPKAHSVAYRTLLLEALCIPTDEPDPDTESNERAAVATRTSSEAVATITPNGSEAVSLGAPSSEGGESGETPPTTASETLATEPQKKRMFAMAREKGLDGGGLKNLVYGVTTKRSTKELTMAEMDAIFEAIGAWRV